MKKILFFTIIGISLLIIINLVTSIYTLWHKQDLLTQAARELQNEKKENISLKSQLKKVSAPGFVEEEARNKLFMVKPGEGEVLIAESSSTSAQKQAQEDSKPYWQQWLSAFSL